MIQNFRKLYRCHIDISNQTTLFVGANNSGKTSAMDALCKFLASRSFVFNDITVSNRKDVSYNNCSSVLKAVSPEYHRWNCQDPKILAEHL